MESTPEDDDFLKSGGEKDDEDEDGSMHTGDEEDTWVQVFYINNRKVYKRILE